MKMSEYYNLNYKEKLLIFVVSVLFLLLYTPPFYGGHDNFVISFLDQHKILDQRKILD